MNSELINACVDSYTDLLCDMADLHLTVDVDGVMDGYSHCIALSTYNEPSVGIFGGTVTPWFHTEAALEKYCKALVLGQVSNPELDSFLADALWESTD